MDQEENQIVKKEIFFNASSVFWMAESPSAWSETLTVKVWIHSISLRFSPSFSRDSISFLAYIHFIFISQSLEKLDEIWTQEVEFQMEDERFIKWKRQKPTEKLRNKTSKRANRSNMDTWGQICPQHNFTLLDWKD